MKTTVQTCAHRCVVQLALVIALALLAVACSDTERADVTIRGVAAEGGQVAKSTTLDTNATTVTSDDSTTPANTTETAPTALRTPTATEIPAASAAPSAVPTPTTDSAPSDSAPTDRAPTPTPTVWIPTPTATAAPTPTPEIFGPPLSGGAAIVPFSVTARIVGGGDETIVLGDSYSGVFGLRDGDTQRFSIPVGTFVIEQDVGMGWPDPDVTCFGTTSVVVEGPKVTLDAEAGQEIACEFVVERDENVLSVRDLSYVCGRGFVGNLEGSSGPFRITFEGESLRDAFGVFEIRTFGTLLVREAGPFETPPNFINFDEVIPGIYPVWLTVEDSAGHRVSLLDATVAFISPQCQGEATVAVYEDISFEFGSALLRETAFDPLSRIAAVLANANTGRIKVTGHTDSVGTEAANLELSQLRAASVARELSNFGVQNERFDVVGAGEAEPIAPNTNSEAANRTGGLKLPSCLATAESIYSASSASSNSRLWVASTCWSAAARFHQYSAESSPVTRVCAWRSKPRLHMASVLPTSEASNHQCSALFSPTIRSCS